MKAKDFIFGRNAMRNAMEIAGIMYNDNVVVDISGGIITIKKDERKSWITKWYNKFEKCNLMCYSDDPIVYVVCERSTGGYVAGIALCGGGDKFDMRTGIAVATAKAFHEPIPDFI